MMKLLVISLVAWFASSGGLAGETEGKARLLLPDLVQLPPTELRVTPETSHGRRFLLTFRSSFANIGDGPLFVVGDRKSGAEPLMGATQRLERSDGSTASRSNVGTFRYVYAEDHQHWHLLDFDRYELYSGRTGRPVRPTRKTGFCLNDEFRVRTHSRKAPRRFTDGCGLNHPELLQVNFGLSPGWGDSYRPFVEGQYINLSGVPTGIYLLVHHLNTRRHLRESNYRNDAACVAFLLDWPHGSEAPPHLSRRPARFCQRRRGD